MYVNETFIIGLMISLVVLKGILQALYFMHDTLNDAASDRADDESNP